MASRAKVIGIKGEHKDVIKNVHTVDARELVRSGEYAFINDTEAIKAGAKEMVEAAKKGNKDKVEAVKETSKPKSKSKTDEKMDEIV